MALYGLAVEDEVYSSLLCLSFLQYVIKTIPIRTLQMMRDSSDVCLSSLIILSLNSFNSEFALLQLNIAPIQGTGFNFTKFQNY